MFKKFDQEVCHIWTEPKQNLQKQHIHCDKKCVRHALKLLKN